ncbi:protein MON2 homolog [Rhagoletis pomonella]|uniref:protein MON2 homolog n=1 Tax=Rhagoletis pomonella TaxID=28610 RepID=UPI001786F43D|nr:protein MON2 homolog [Rhagoletis pomonella]
MLSVSDSLLTPLNEGILDCMDVIQKESMDDTCNNNRKSLLVTTAGVNASLFSNVFTGRLAVTALLHRFKEVLKHFNDDDARYSPRQKIAHQNFYQL